MGSIRQTRRRGQAGGGRKQARGPDAGTVLEIESGTPQPPAPAAEPRSRPPADEAFEAACRSLAARRQTRTELARKLARKRFAADVVDAALERAARLGFLDDAGLAADHARALADGRLYGRRRIAQALAARGLARETVDAALDAAAPEDAPGEGERARLALERARRVPPPGDRDARRKAAQYLARRGFDWDAIDAALDGPSDEPDGDA